MMPTYHEKGDAIEGEKIGFRCRKFRPAKRPVAGSSRHRAQAGKLELAYCVILRKLRPVAKREPE